MVTTVRKSAGKVRTLVSSKDETHFTSETIQDLNPDDVLLDPNNPRIRPILAAQGIKNPSQKQIEDAILVSRDWKSGRGGHTTSFQQFLGAVRQDRRINEPPVVRRTTKGELVAVHGNNRLLAAKQLKKEMPGNGFDMVRCRVLPSDTPQSAIDEYMLISHRTPQADWHPVAMAHMIYELANPEIGGIGAMNSKELQDEFRMGPQTIKQKVMAYGEMVRYMGETGDHRPLALWVYFEEVYRTKQLKDLFESDDEFRQTYYDLVREKKLDDSQYIKAIPKIREDADAWDHLLHGQGARLKSAYQIVSGDIESENHFDRLAKLSKIVKDISSNGPRAKHIKRNPSQLRIVTELATAVNELLEKAGLK
jgi:hypothetical protein